MRCGLPDRTHACHEGEGARAVCVPTGGAKKISVTAADVALAPQCDALHAATTHSVPS